MNIYIYILFLLFVTQNVCAQKKLLSLDKLRKKPIYVLEEEVKKNGFSCFDDDTSKVKLLKAYSVKKNVYRLRLRDFAVDTFPINPEDYPNVQELDIRCSNFSLDDIVSFKNLQILYISGAGQIEGCEKCMTPVKNYSSISKMKELRELVITCSEDYIFFENLRELTKLEKIDAFRGGGSFLPVEYIAFNNIKDISINEIKYRRPDLMLYYYVGLFQVTEELPYIERLKVPQTGKFIVNYPNGSKLVEGKFEEGRPDGRWLFWREDGSLYQERNYFNGKKHGIWILWNVDGSVGIYREYRNESLIAKYTSFPRRYGTYEINYECIKREQDTISTEESFTIIYEYSSKNNSHSVDQIRLREICRDYTNKREKEPVREFYCNRYSYDNYGKKLQFEKYSIEYINWSFEIIKPYLEKYPEIYKLHKTVRQIELEEQ